ncbi:MAG: translocation protein TolB [candidate division NC10 bacterium]|nr:translocation protein TolB [candidate division NC10 bacterium]
MRMWQRRTRLAALVTVAFSGWLAIASGQQKAPKPQQANADALLGAAQYQEQIEGRLEAAIATYRKVLAAADATREQKARALFQLGQCQEKLGQAEARRSYERLVKEYGDQAEIVAQARTRLSALERAGGLDHPSGITLRKVWAGAEAAGPGYSSPDGRYFTFTNDDGDLIIRNLATGESRRLTRDGSTGEEYLGLISPDSRQVAYSHGNELRMVDIDGSRVRTLVPANKEASEVNALAWSPDQKRILAVIAKEDKSTQIVFVSVADGPMRVLKSLPPRTKANSGRRAVSASLSPDARYIVYDFFSGEACREHDIFLLSADGNIDRPLIQHPADDWRPVWTPDGKRVLFASNRDGTWGFWTTAVADGKAEGTAELLKPDIGDMRWLSGFDSQGALYYIVNAGREDVYVAEMDPNTGMLTQQPVAVPSRFVGRNLAPTWSPDGEYLAYLSHRGEDWLYQPGAVVIVIRSVRTGEERDLAANLNLMMGPVQWFPDGRSLLVGGYEGTYVDGTATLYRVDVQTGTARTIHQIRRDAGLPTLSPDAKVVYYWQRQEEELRLIAHQMESGEEKELYSAPGSWIAALAVSPDGRQLGIAHTDGTSEATILKVMSVAGGDARVLLRTEPTASISCGSRLEWTRDGRYMVVARFTGREQNVHTDPTELWHVPVEGAKPQRIGPSMERIRFPSLHPDGRHIAFDSGTLRWRKLEVWAMENFLPGLRPAR